ncbi:unnamed protein product [Aphanomyces euteiches]|nr:hypothetical protein AeRB84_015777 [Aphanomyces euteiches]
MNLLGEYSSSVIEGSDDSVATSERAPNGKEGNESAHAWRLEKRRSKYVKARQFLEEQFAETGIECPVRSLEGLTFASWQEFHDVLQEYMRETNQTYISRDSKTTPRYNAEQVKRKVKHFIPIPTEFSHARIRFDCKHSHSNMSKNLSLFETKAPKESHADGFHSSHPKRKAREGSFYSACPVKMHVQVHKNAATLGEWRVLVTNHVHVHNHNLVNGLVLEPIQEPPRLIPVRLDESRRERAFNDLFSFFTSYQAPRQDPSSSILTLNLRREDDDAFHRRYGDMYMYIYQSLVEDKCVETDEAMLRFRKLAKPSMMLRRDKRIEPSASQAQPSPPPPPSSSLHLSTSSGSLSANSHYQL